MKKRIIFALVLFVLLCGACLPVGYYLHAVLSRQTVSLSFDIGRMISGVFGSPAALRLWLLLCALCGLFCIWAMVGSTCLNYKNGMYQVTPDIFIPLPAGHGEFGTAWWMSPKRLKKVFTSVRTSKDCLQELAAQGEWDYAQIESLRQQGLLDAKAGRNGRGEQA